MTDAAEKSKQTANSLPGKQTGRTKRQGRSLPGHSATVAGQSQVEGEAKTEGSGRVSEVMNGVPSSNTLNSQKAPDGLGPSRLAFNKDVTASGQQHSNDDQLSPEADGPSLSDSIDILLDSPWSGNGSGDITHDGPPGSRMLPPCASCNMLKAELDTVREELRLTQASTLYGLSGTSLRDLSEALDTVVHILNNRKSLSAKGSSQNVAEISSRPVWQERNHF
ncbi:hypothetical protein JRQ81_011659 [Phrynocephalus forsythii]|uniref:Uncharacterized protein n=1 Tax=Phrynocephalus forsythii TaxID=171643 RepID=A0A9Q0X6C5_9SAUR|nr:hypothetical protein JRQ81_011659 [Phrynocephalus forsythii]